MTAVAAHPLRVPEIEREAISGQRRRSGYLEIFARTDRLAAECVRIVNTWDGCRDFPFSNPERIDAPRSMAPSGPRGCNLWSATPHLK